MTKYKTHSFGHIMKKMSGRIVYYITKHSTTIYYWYFLHKTTRQPFSTRVADKVQQKGPLFCIFIGFCRVEGTKKGVLLLLASSIHYHFQYTRSTYVYYIPSLSGQKFLHEIQEKSVEILGRQSKSRLILLDECVKNKDGRRSFKKFHSQRAKSQEFLKYLGISCQNSNWYKVDSRLILLIKPTKIMLFLFFLNNEGSTQPQY